jgi:hypothetical protein
MKNKKIFFCGIILALERDFGIAELLLEGIMMDKEGNGCSS